MRPHPLLLALLLALPAGGFAAPFAALPAPMLAVQMPGSVEVAGYLVSEKLDGVRARWDGRALWTRSGHRIHAPARFTHGWPRTMRLRKPRFSSRAWAAPSPTSTAMPWARRWAMPCPATRGLGSSKATTTLATPASDKATQQGPVRPVCAQGSSVT